MYSKMYSRHLFSYSGLLGSLLFLILDLFHLSDKVIVSGNN